jgi:hypothetical protein
LADTPSAGCSVAPPCSTGTCDGAGACNVAVAGTSCGASCTGASRVPKVCNGQGACVDDGIKPCDPGYACEGSICVPCWTCSEFLAGGTTGPACPGSDARLSELQTCACNPGTGSSCMTCSLCKVDGGDCGNCFPGTCAKAKNACTSDT